MTTNNTPLLTIDNLDVKFRLDRETVHAVRGVSFSLNKGETLALVGESGSGKSVTAMSIVRLHPDNMTEYGADSKIAFEGVSMLDAPPETLRQLRGNRIGMIFQEPMTSLNPFMRIGEQLGEAIAAHHPKTPAEQIRARCKTLLERVGINETERRLKQYPHEFSGAAVPSAPADCRRTHHRAGRHYPGGNP